MAQRLLFSARSHLYIWSQSNVSYLRQGIAFIYILNIRMPIIHSPSSGSKHLRRTPTLHIVGTFRLCPRQSRFDGVQHKVLPTLVRWRPSIMYRWVFPMASTRKDGINNQLGDQHRKQRKMLNPVFSIAHMRGMGSYKGVLHVKICYWFCPNSPYVLRRHPQGNGCKCIWYTVSHHTHQLQQTLAKKVENGPQEVRLDSVGILAVSAKLIPIIGRPRVLDDADCPGVDWPSWYWILFRHPWTGWDHFPLRQGSCRAHVIRFL